jgi:hypothetical protein
VECRNELRPNGFVRDFNVSIGSAAAVLEVRSSYETRGDFGQFKWHIRPSPGSRRQYPDLLLAEQ